LTVIENLKATSPPEPKKGQKRLRPEVLHIALVKSLEDRIDAIDAELVVSRCSCWETVIIGTSSMMVSFWSADPVLIFCADDFYSVFKKYGGKSNKGSYYLHKPRSERRGRELEHELRNPIMCITTILARSGRFQLFLFNDLFLAQDEGADEYTYQDDEQDDEYEQDSMNDGYGTRRGRQSTGKGTRRSARNTNSKRAGSSDSALWRGERRSSRLAGTDAPFEEDPPGNGHAQKTVKPVRSRLTDQSSKTLAVFV
jgi:hypothetical protein